MEEKENDLELGHHAEKLISHIESELQYDEEGKSFFKKESILNLIFKVAEFMRQLSKRV